MKRYLPIMILLLFAFSSLAASSYPDLTPVDQAGESTLPLEAESIAVFLDSWRDEAHPTTFSLLEQLETTLKENDWQLQQLADVVGIQEAQLEFSLSQGKPTWGVSATPYTYNDMTVQTGGAPTRTKSHSFQAGGTLTDTLSSGATLQLSANQKSSYSMTSTKDAWTQTPSVSLSLRQPLWIGEGLVDLSYQDKQVEKQRIALSDAIYSKEGLQRALILQNIRLLLLRQSLLENRYILSARVSLADTARKRAKDDLEEGLISRQAYESSQLAYQQSLSAYQAVNRELDTLSVTLERVWQDDLPPQVSLSIFNPVSLMENGYDLDALLSRYLSQDTAYQQALLEMQKATIDTGMFSVQDAPSLQLSFQMSPFYSPSKGNSFFSSFSELFSDADPQITFSIAFSATDLFRKSSSLQQTLAQRALDSAKAGLELAYAEAEDTVQEMRQEIAGYLSDLGVQLADYRLKEALLSSEQIRFEASISDKQSLLQRELDWYQAAFAVLGTLRELEFRYLQMRLQGLLG
nr:TolC family protein [uncultured Sphaerochaeta sp.]